MAQQQSPLERLRASQSPLQQLRAERSPLQQLRDQAQPEDPMPELPTAPTLSDIAEEIINFPEDMTDEEARRRIQEARETPGTFAEFWAPTTPSGVIKTVAKGLSLVVDPETGMFETSPLAELGKEATGVPGAIRTVQRASDPRALAAEFREAPLATTLDVGLDALDAALIGVGGAGLLRKYILPSRAARAMEAVPFQALDDVPSIPDAGLATDEAANAIARGDLPTPIAAVEATEEMVEPLQGNLRGLYAALNMSKAQQDLFNVAMHGSKTPSTDPAILKRQAEYLHEALAGRQNIPATQRQAAQLREDYGPKWVREPKEGENPFRLPAKTPGPGEDALEYSLSPTPLVLESSQDANALLAGIRPDDRVVPEVARVMRPRYEAFYQELDEFHDKYRRLTGNLKAQDSSDKIIARLLDGEWGPVKELEAPPSGVSPTELAIAKEARNDLDLLWSRLREVVPDLPYNPNYITYLRDEYLKGGKLLAPPDLIRPAGRRVYFGFMERLGEEAPKNLSFVESMNVYLPAALKKIHLDPGLEQVGKEIIPAYDRLGQNIKKMRAQHYMSTATGERNFWQRSFDEMVNQGLNSRAAQKINQFLPERMQIRPTARPSLRLSLGLTNGLYRGILGGNISASLNNFTQSVNTMASQGVFPTIEGAKEMLTQEGRALARSARLQNDYNKIFEESSAALKSLSGGAWSKLDDVLFAPFQAAENINRGIAFHAGYGKALRAGATPEAAMQIGRQVSQETQFVYDQMARNSTILSQLPFGRQMMVLTSFPIKQTEFLAGLAKNDQLALLRYFAVTGFLDRALQGSKLGATVAPLEPVMEGAPPGTEYLRTLEGAPLEAFPAGSIATGSMRALNALIDGNPRQVSREVGNVLDSISNIVVPGGVQARELLRAGRNIQEGEFSQPTGVVPFARELGPRSPRVTRYTTPQEEVLRVIGLRPPNMARDDAVYKALTEFTRTETNERIAARDAALYLWRQGQYDEAVQVLKEGQIDLPTFERDLEQSDYATLLRRFLDLSIERQAQFKAAYPDEFDRVMELAGQYNQRQWGPGR